MADKTIILKKGEGKALWMLGSLYEVKAGSDETGGTVTVMEMTIAPNHVGDAPPHKHNCGEAAYVLEGSLRYHVGDRIADAPAGTFVYSPKGTQEWFENPTDKPARILAIYMPGGMDKFFTEVAEPAGARSLPPPPTSPPDFGKLEAVAKKYGLELQLPARK